MNIYKINLIINGSSFSLKKNTHIYTYIYMVESLCFSLETITTLLIGYNPTQNKKLKKKRKKEKRKKSMC